MQQVRKPIPKTPAERVQDAIVPYELADYGKTPPVTENRAQKVSVKGSRDKDFSVKLIDIDTAVIQHIQQNIKPSVYSNTELIDVPVIYAFPERWVAIQKDGFLRDNAGKIMTPLIVVNRTDAQKNRNVSRNLDSNVAQNVHVFRKTYTSKNAYTNFNIANNVVPVQEFAVVAHPDYFTITYEINIYTNFVEQLNRVIEAMQYAENSYWGDKNRYYFRVNIDTFPSVVSYTQGEERTVSSKLILKLYGYLIPDTVNAYLSKDASFVSKAQIIINEETVSSNPNIVLPIPKINSPISSGTMTNSNNALVAASLVYLNTNTQAVATVVSTTKAVLYNKTILAAPSSFPPTSKTNFTIFINGLNASYTEFEMQQVGSNIEFTFDTTLLGYTLIPGTDEVLVIGKFT